MSAQKVLLRWAEDYLRFRDAHACDIKSISADESSLKLDCRSRNKTCAVLPELSLVPADIIITLNNEENIDVLVKGWGKYAKKQDLLIVFANPLAGAKWLLKPFVHAKIADEKTLRKGIVSLTEDVPYVDMKEFS